jgi:glycosyltransferase involved in cell wall biosynthesis
MIRNSLLLFHCGSNTGYAIASLEHVFDAAARRGLADQGDVHYGYRSLSKGRPIHLMNSSSEVLEVDYVAPQTTQNALARWIRSRDISHVLAFDLPIQSTLVHALRQGGVKRVVSYWGASISSIYPWYLRPLRRLQYHFAIQRPDTFIFESTGMQDGAVLGAGIPRRHTRVIRVGVDCEIFTPAAGSRYAHAQFGIPPERKIVFFSGHMEERKGVHILIAAIRDIVMQGYRDVHLLLAGNTADDEARLRSIVSGTVADGHVTFAGYRSDMPAIQQSASLGVIASTGWDSFTMSAAELAACGVPLIVSDLPGLREAVVAGRTGAIVPAGNTRALAQSIVELLNAESIRSAMSLESRRRALSEFSKDRQIRQLAECLYEAR